MNTSQIITAVLGLFGFLLGAYNLWRAIRSNREIRTLAYAQRKQEVLAAISDGEAAFLSVKRQLHDIEDEALDEQLMDLKSEVEGFIQDQQRLLKKLREARSKILSLGSNNRTHDELVNMIEDQLVQIRDLTHAKKIEEEAQEFIQPAKRAITLAKRARGSANV